MAKFYDMLVYLRKRAGLSQQALAQHIGISRSTLAMYETGKREPNLETFEAFADFFNVDMNTLTGQGISEDGPSLSPAQQLLFESTKDLSEEQILKLLGIIDEAKKLF